MNERIITQGDCPYCNTRFNFDEGDRKAEYVKCTRCSQQFLIINALNLTYDDKPEYDPKLIYSKIDTVRDRKGHRIGYRGYVEHKGLNRAVNIPGNSSLTYVNQRIQEEAFALMHKWKLVQDQVNKEIFTKNSSQKLRQDLMNHKSFLKDSVNNPQLLDWERFKKYADFTVPEPVFNEAKPIMRDAQPRPNPMELISKTYKEKQERLREEDLSRRINIWEEHRDSFENTHKNWLEEKETFFQEQSEWNERIESEKKLFESGDKMMIEKYITRLLVDSVYPEKFPENIVIEYKPEEKVLLIDYELPEKDCLPQYKDSTINKKTGEVDLIPFKENELSDLYNDVLYSIVIRTLHEVFINDPKNNISAIVFNGFVDVLNKGSGHKQIVYILSLFAKKDEFKEFNLEHVDPEACFKKLKGVGATVLSSLTPIPPVMLLDRKDKRFVEARVVVDSLADSVNIAAMKWEDFEHLVREIIEKEFGTAGMEVKITQSSRDMGVDAIAFDPDPLRGGKIIIQAKRYTNTVKVESVRALYGVMQDEGAMKGIMVTTSDYGPDAYKFAQGKPISLISGSNLLSLLEKHGRKAIINLSEAKKILKDEGRI